MCVCLTEMSVFVSMFRFTPEVDRTYSGGGWKFPHYLCYIVFYCHLYTSCKHEPKFWGVSGGCRAEGKISLKSGGCAYNGFAPYC